ncbi:MAG: molybdopterin-synthase adenylyltransferase MoeB [Acidimicrobiia bacterium]|nr:molybdopterin-synthase adenylyltransferase MoeB [Acidimicrobiia bacterium]
MDYAELVAAARSRITELTPAEVEQRVAAGSAILIDVREMNESDGGSLDTALRVPRGVLESTIAERVPDRDREIVLFCSVGERSALAAVTLEDLGYANVASMAGGLARWRAEGRTWSSSADLSDEQRARYSRHTSLLEVGEQGQSRLLESSVLIVGAGGLSSPAALYLAAAGVGTIGIVDFDIVDSSNLQRQILHNLDRIGQAKVASARETLMALNPDVKVEAYQDRLDAANALDIMSRYDLVIDGSDNFPTRYLVNDASIHLGLPVVHGSIFKFEGQVAVFRPGDGPCYRCLFPLPPPPELAPSCVEAGVLGVLPGVVGSILAMEAIKMILGIGRPLVNRLLVYDALDERFESLAMHRDPECAACGHDDRAPVLVDYDDACASAGTIPRT